MNLLYTIASITLIIVAVYAFLIRKFIKGWKKIPYFEPKKSEQTTRVTIITPCKNEIKHLPFLFQVVKEQSYRNFEFILVDDGSTDGSFEYAGEVSLGFPEMKVIRNLGFGKKSAIRTGTYLSKSELIITLDADSFPSPDWLKTIVQFYAENPSDLMVCPVQMDDGKTFFHRFQQFEFTSLVASGAGALGAGMPILCNGANLAFRREEWLLSESDLQFDEPSGDDIFLLQSIKSRNGVIRFLKSAEASTTTYPAENLRSFFNQRKRWASKLSAYNDSQLAFTALTVFLTCFVVLFSLIFTWIDARFVYLFLVLFFVKWITDFLLFKAVKPFFKLKNVLLNSLIFSVFYPFYIVLTAGSAIFRKEKKW